ncbi:MAG: hypothetical protein AAB615_01195 [Patescibacteria group bacterium]
MIGEFPMQRVVIVVLIRENGQKKVLCQRGKLPEVLLKPKEDPLNGFTKYCQEYFPQFRFNRRLRTTTGPHFTGHNRETFVVFQYVDAAVAFFVESEMEQKAYWRAHDELSDIGNVCHVIQDHLQTASQAA